VSHCYAVATLPNWIKSKGAGLEVGTAISLDMDVQPVDHWLAKAAKLAHPTQEAA
jgi:hypothetical protein